MKEMSSYSLVDGLSEAQTPIHSTNIVMYLSIVHACVNVYLQKNPFANGMQCVCKKKLYASYLEGGSSLFRIPPSLASATVSVSMA